MDIAVVVQGQAGVSWKEWQTVARTCEQHGVPTLLSSDHYSGFAGTDGGALEPWGTICALAAVTTRLRLGTLVSPVTFRSPAVLSKLVSTADHVSDGRVELGIGAGWDQREHAQFELPFPPLSERMNLLERHLRTLHEHWEADWYLPTPVQRPHPPLILGGRGGTRSVALAARWADEYNMPNLSPEEAARFRESLAAACHQLGRDPIRFSVMLPLVLGPTRAAVAATLDRIAKQLGRDLGETAIRGSVGEVIEILGGYQDAGVDRVVLGHPLHRDLDTIGLIGNAVVPALAD